MFRHSLRFLLSLITLAMGFIVSLILLQVLFPHVWELPIFLGLLLLHFCTAVIVSYVFGRLYQVDAQPIFLLTLVVLPLVHFTVLLFFYFFGEAAVFGSTYGLIPLWLYAASMLTCLLQDRRFLSRADP